MITPVQLEALKEAYEAAKASEHIFAPYAACEVMLETGWGTSELYKDYNNAFGQKQQADPVFHTVQLPTWEVLQGHRFDLLARFIWFPDKAASFTQRMQTLERLSQSYAEYAAALHAPTGEEFVTHVSKRWSTDPDRALKVLSIYHAHKDVFAQVSA